MSNKQEKEVALELNGKVQIASGALDDKADVRSSDFLVECKTSEKEYYLFRTDTWNKVYREASKLGLCPVMCVYTKDRPNSIEGPNKYCILRKSDFDFYVLSSGSLGHLITSSESSKVEIVKKNFHKQTKTCIGHTSIYEELISDCFTESMQNGKYFSSVIVFPWELFLQFINKGE